MFKFFATAVLFALLLVTGCKKSAPAVSQIEKLPAALSPTSDQDIVITIVRDRTWPWQSRTETMMVKFKPSTTAPTTSRVN